MTIKPTEREIADDLEKASQDNLESYEALTLEQYKWYDWESPVQDSCHRCGRPKVISGYGTWFAYGRSHLRILLYYSCECELD